VGAAIAAGNQLVKGAWALFVKVSLTKRHITINLMVLVISLKLCTKIQYPKVIIKSLSPIRLVRRVSMAPFILDQF